MKRDLKILMDFGVWGFGVRDSSGFGVVGLRDSSGFGVLGLRDSLG